MRSQLALRVHPDARPSSSSSPPHARGRVCRVGHSMSANLVQFGRDESGQPTAYRQLADKSGSADVSFFRCSSASPVFSSSAFSSHPRAARPVDSVKSDRPRLSEFSNAGVSAIASEWAEQLRDRAVEGDMQGQRARRKIRKKERSWKKERNELWAKTDNGKLQKYKPCEAANLRKYNWKLESEKRSLFSVNCAADMTVIIVYGFSSLQFIRTFCT